MMEHLVPVFHTTSIPIDGSSKLGLFMNAAKGQSKRVPHALSRMSRRQMHPYLREQLPNPPSDLEKTWPRGVQLRSARSALDELPSQGVHQPVGRCV